MERPMFERAAWLRTSLLVLFAGMIAACGGGTMKTPAPPACVPSTQPEFAYVLNGDPANTVSMYTINSCTGSLTPTTPATIPTGVNSESMVVDPSGKFVYVANLVSNASDLASISMFTFDPTTGVLTATTPPTV